MISINISREFSTTPGGRKRAHGKHSAEEFLESMLLPKYLEAVKAGVPLHVELDGTYGYAASFLDEAFAGLTCIHTPEVVLANLEFTSIEEPQLIDDIKGYIKEATE